MNLIEVRNLSKVFAGKEGPLKALDDVTFSVEAGEAFGFIGPNGAGKSTAIKILLGIVGSYTGEVFLNGTPAREAVARCGVGYVPESPSIYEVLTPMDMLRHAVAMHRLVPENPARLCMEWLERFSIAPVANRRIKELSKGTVQRVALAHAMVVSPKLLILDEPLSGLDPVGRKDVVDILADYRRQGGTLFFTSHVLHDVERIADHFALVHKGKLRTVKSPSELVGEEQIVQVRTIGKTAVEGMMQDSEGRWVGDFRGDALWSVLNRLQGAGHALIEVKPALSLERAFLRFIKEDLDVSRGLEK